MMSRQYIHLQVTYPPSLPEMYIYRVQYECTSYNGKSFNHFVWQLLVPMHTDHNTRFLPLLLPMFDKSLTILITHIVIHVPRAILLMLLAAIKIIFTPSILANKSIMKKNLYNTGLCERCGRSHRYTYKIAI